MAALLLGACGADGSGSPPPVAPAPPPAPSDEVVGESPAADPAESEPAAEAEPAPEPEPIVVEAGVRIGPVRLGMTEEDLSALGLEVEEIDPRTRAFGPYRVRMDDGAVDWIEAFLGDLGSVRIGDEVFEPNQHIHAFRDHLADCVWQEGGGERYRCRDGHLWVETTHSLSPSRYALRVE